MFLGAFIFYPAFASVVQYAVFLICGLSLIEIAEWRFVKPNFTLRHFIGSFEMVSSQDKSLEDGLDPAKTTVETLCNSHLVPSTVAAFRKAWQRRCEEENSVQDSL